MKHQAVETYQSQVAKEITLGCTTACVVADGLACPVQSSPNAGLDHNLPRWRSRPSARCNKSTAEPLLLPSRLESR